MIETIKRPYEFLVRWREGQISGAHVGFELTASEDGKALPTTPLPVMPVDIGQGVGFPLADILEQLHIDAIASMDAAHAECKSKTEECAKHEATIAALQAEVNELKIIMAKDADAQQTKAAALAQHLQDAVDSLLLKETKKA